MKTSQTATVIATFGKGNDAVLEKLIIDDNVKDIVNQSQISVDTKAEKKKYVITSKKRTNGTDSLSCRPDKPDEKSGMDLLGLKNELEQEVFGTTFGDNIRVQIAYNVFDVVKALSPVSSNITYTLNSLDRVKGHKEDIIGNSINYRIAYAQFGKGNNTKILAKKDAFSDYLKNAKDNFAYFDDIFYHNETRQNKNKTEMIAVLNSDEYIYNALLPASFLRNNISHFNSKHFNLLQKNYNNAEIVQTVINKAFKSKVETVNKNFIDNEQNNLFLIAKSLKAENDEASLKNLACELYELSVTKSNKNLGFNLKKLREYAIAQELITLPFSEQLLNTFKSKLYKIIDFLVIHFLNNIDTSNFIGDIVDSLRASLNDEEKEKIYSDYAKRLFQNSELKEQIKTAVGLFKSEAYKDKNNKIEIPKEWIKPVEITDKVHDFSKLIYYLSRFLDGKEINILLTALISKFQVIDAFNKTVSELFEMQEIESHNYTEKYGIFRESGEIAEELNFIKSITRMTVKYSNISLENMYKDAMLSLGVSVQEVDSLYAEYFGKDAKTRLSAFFRNNVLESGRFKYVVKYINPAQINKIARNKLIVKYVLGRMPQTQIDRYYSNVVNPQDVLIGSKGKIKEIAELIVKTKFNVFTNENLYNIEKDDKDRKIDNEVREKKKALLSLYYTIVYLFVKNIVQINTYYMIGFFYLERDKYFFGKKLDKDFSEKENYDALTRLFTGLVPSDVKKLKSNEISKLKRYIYINNNPDQTNSFSKQYDRLYITFRNFVDHLSVVSQLASYVEKIDKVTSYFAVYHFALQRIVFNEIAREAKRDDNEEYKKNAEKSLEYIKGLLKISADTSDFESGENVVPYSKPLLRAMNIPFGYTVPRYKNLSYENLFNRGRDGD